MISKNRKWKAVVWRIVLDTCVVGAGIGLAFMRPTREVALPFVIAGFADLTALYAIYFASNVVQKGIISKNYKKELDKDEL
jgi:NAD/NADP transhydrogenase beta subunit